MVDNKSMETATAIECQVCETTQPEAGAEYHGEHGWICGDCITEAEEAQLDRMLDRKGWM